MHDSSNALKEIIALSGQRSIYWICSKPTPLVQEKVEILRRFHIEVSMIPDLLTLSRSYSQNRLNTILINDDLIDRNLHESLQKIAVRPEYAGVRMILSKTGVAPDFVSLAVAMGFRDIIPLDLSPEEWIRRYVFASAGHPTDLAEPLPQMGLRNIAALHVPARISWISEKELWLETRLIPPVGSQLNITGGLCELLGVHHVAVKVIEHHQTHLHYRYSDALLCRWDLPRQMQEKKQPLIAFIQAQKEAPPHRIYNIVRTQNLRKGIIRQLDPRHFHLYMALNKTNMIHEPKYISPDAIVIEDLMCSGSNRVAFKEMVDQLPSGTPIFVIGPNGVNDPFQDFSRSVSITTLAELPVSFGSFLNSRIGPPKVLREGATFVPKSHNLSFAQVVLPARLTSIHPQSVQLALHFPLGRFGICAMESTPFTQSLGRKVHLKVIQGRQHIDPALAGFPYHINGLIIDLKREERWQLAQHLVAYYQQKLLPAPEPANKPKLKSRNLPPEAISIDPSAEEGDSSPVDEAEAGPSRMARFFSKEVKIGILVIFIFAIFFALIIKFHDPEEEGNIYSDQLRIFKEMHSPARRGLKNPP